MKTILVFITVFIQLLFPQQGNSNDEILKTQKKVDILNYNFKIQLFPDKKFINCESEIIGVLKNQDIDEIDINLYDNLSITDLQLNKKKTSYFRKDNIIHIKNDKSGNDTVRILIKYNGSPRRSGFDGFVFGEVNGQSLIYNISEPEYASTWFACDDDPSDKAILNIEITNDSQFVSVSNGILQSVTTSEEKKTYKYESIYPMSTYLIAVYSAPYKHFNDIYTSIDGKDSMVIDYYVMPEHFEYAKIDFADHTNMLKVFSELFGEYPFIKEKYGVAEFLWNFGAMENQTITGIGYNFISGRDFYKDTYVHELSHHWWGNSVTLKSWKDIWLNEGFASYCEALYAEAKYGKSALISKMLNKFSEHFHGTLYAPKDLFGETVYDKGAWVLHMLRYEIGDSNFFKVLREYYNKYKYSNASVEDFKNVCENISGKVLKKFFDEWIYTGTEIPECDYSYFLDSSNGKVICTFELLQKQEKYPEFHFPLEVELIYDRDIAETKQLYIDSKEKMFRFEVQNKDFKILVDPDSHLLAKFNNISIN